MPNREKLASLDCEVLTIHSSTPPIYWRLFACDEHDLEACIVRDADSIVNAREAAAVKEWMESDKLFHMMHDEKAGHFHKVMAGMWGIKKNNRVSF